MSDTSDLRPSKKQKELLSFLDAFIAGHGYGPSYREIMRSLDYKSVSTVAVHVNNLIAKGLVRKRDRSARSLEVVKAHENNKPRHLLVCFSLASFVAKHPVFVDNKKRHVRQNTRQR